MANEAERSRRQIGASPHSRRRKNRRSHNLSLQDDRPVLNSFRILSGQVVDTEHHL
ncbi:MAG: hypothetical protein IKI44_05490 [Bacteroidaceae bacterium]|nr:hypothetical protein [Bacteroidaceae bacterium]MBR7052423.1 hypothetical protein [Bacteroidaceae bacterium]